jgi:hypothetical protein
MDSYEKRRAELESANLPLFHGFHGYLIKKRVGKRVSCNHIDRLEFFANVFLIDYQDQALAEGYDEVSAFLGDWFIRKDMGSDEASLSANIETFQKFYDYLRSIGHLDELRHAELQTLIEDSKGDWLHYLKRYNDPSIELEDVWDFEDSDDLDPADEERAGESHFVFMLSGLAAKHFEVRSSDLPKVDHFGDQGHWSSCWRCDAITSHTPSRTTYFLLTNARTLYSLVIPNTDHQIGSLLSMFFHVLQKEIKLLNPSIALPHGCAFSLARGQPRSLIGSQNELIRCTIHLFAKPDPSLEVLCRHLNHIPMTALEEDFPDKAFKKYLAADPPTASESNDAIIPFPQPSPN